MLIIYLTDMIIFTQRATSLRLFLVIQLITNTLPGPSASEVTTLWRYTNIFIIIILACRPIRYIRRLYTTGRNAYTLSTCRRTRIFFASRLQQHIQRPVLQMQTFAITSMTKTVTKTVMLLK